MVVAPGEWLQTIEDGSFSIQQKATIKTNQARQNGGPFLLQKRLTVRGYIRYVFPIFKGTRGTLPGVSPMPKSRLNLEVVYVLQEGHPGWQGETGLILFRAFFLPATITHRPFHFGRQLIE
jgi:hypothetical protein